MVARRVFYDGRVQGVGFRYSVKSITTGFDVVGSVKNLIDGRVELEWTHAADERLNLRWTETGGPAVQSPTRRGFGSRIITQMIGQLDGKARFDWRTEGLICEITFGGEGGLHAHQ